MTLLLKNETIISKEKIKKVNKYANAKRVNLISIFKFIICLFIIIYSIFLLNKNNIETIIYILFAIWGLKNTVIKKIRKEKLIYKFYDDHFEVNVSDRSLYVDYKIISEVVEEEKNYYIILNKSGLFIDKNSFVIGTGDNMLNFLKEKFNIKINEQK